MRIMNHLKNCFNFNNKKAFSALTSVLLLTSALLSGCSPSAKLTQLTPLNIGTMPTQTASIYAVGLEKGFFKKHMVDLKLTVFKSAIERDAAATAGELDGFLTDIMGAVNLQENGFDFKMTSSEYENFCVMTNAQQAATSPADLKGLKVGIANNTVTDFMADSLLKEVAITKENLPKVPERLSALLSNTLQAGVFPEPFVSIIQAKQGKILASSAEADIQPVVFVFNQQLLKDNLPAAKAFYAAYNETVAYMKSTPYNEYKSVLVDYKMVTPELVDKIQLPLDHYGNAKSVRSTDIDLILKWMTEKQMIQKTHTPESLVFKGLYE